MPVELLFVAIIGLCVGSFTNVLIIRLYEGRGLGGRSRCGFCNAVIHWHDNVPVLSFLLLKGKCRRCEKSIAWQYPAVEIAVALLFILVWLVRVGGEGGVLDVSVQQNIVLVRDWIMAVVLTVIFVQDLRWYVIIDALTLPAIVAVTSVNLLLGYDWRMLVAGAAIGGGFFGLQFLLSRGRWIGGGDIRLGVLMGALLGFPQVVTALMIAYITGAAVGVGLLAIGKKQWSSQVPFGTFLSVATLVVLLFGEVIVSSYVAVLLGR